LEFVIDENVESLSEYLLIGFMIIITFNRPKLYICPQLIII